MRSERGLRSAEAPCPVSLMYGAIPSATGRSASIMSRARDTAFTKWLALVAGFFRGWLAVSFYVPAVVAGKFALITAPDTFLVQCPKAGSNTVERIAAFASNVTMGVGDTHDTS